MSWQWMTFEQGQIVLAIGIMLLMCYGFVRMTKTYGDYRAAKQLAGIEEWSDLDVRYFQWKFASALCHLPTTGFWLLGQVVVVIHPAFVVIGYEGRTLSIILGFCFYGLHMYCLDRADAVEFQGDKPGRRNDTE